MNKYPRTKAEAALITYGRYKAAYDESRCSFEVYQRYSGNMIGTHCQCERKPGKGPGGLYCGHHAMKAEAFLGEEGEATVWYVVTQYSDEARPAEVIKSTASRVWLKGSGRADNRSSQYGTYYPTRKEAKTAIKKRLDSHISSLTQQLKDAKKRRAALK